MTTSPKPQILLTNDDGIDSPGLWAAAEALSEIGYVWVAAPREQSSGAGRSMPSTSDGRITPQLLTVHGKDWTVYAVGGTPAQTVQHAILEIMGGPPALVVSGINYGLNLGNGITVSGTVGAAMEAASHGIPALAVSLETAKEYHLSYSREIDFRPAAYFTKYFAERLLNGMPDPEVQVLKIEVPVEASADTPWEIARLASTRYYLPDPPIRGNLSDPGAMGYLLESNLNLFPEDSDVFVVLAKKKVAVTPLTLDMTAPVDFRKLKQDLNSR
ncbi:MAG: 5'/3'-nucleotidase SurE [Anaerolineae bacterium]|nr:MAG: 5'/3'-nucleotidase SurE [Anaerolineae bacterium]